MSVSIDKNGQGSVWRDFHCDIYQGYRPNMSDYHMHEYYEISLILSGDVKVLLPRTVHQGKESRLLLIPPMTAHLVLCEPHALYKRINLLFSPDFLSSLREEETELIKLFDTEGRVVVLDDAESAELYNLALEMQLDEDPLRRRLRLMIFLSKIKDRSTKSQEKSEALPTYITEAVSYIQENYGEKIVAGELAEMLKIGRTTLMTAFKRYTGTTLSDYIMRYRVNKARKYLKQGKSQKGVAELCGFGATTNMTRVFKRCLGLTPGEFVKTLDFKSVQ